MSRSLANSVIIGFKRPAKRQSAFTCLYQVAPSSRSYSTSPCSQIEQQDYSDQYSNRGRELREEPRWASTPARMQAPFRSKPFTLNSEFEVNSDPEKLDRVYNQVLGRDGDQMLTEAVKWLAVTHKSFDHGRRGYNDRLAYIGRRIVELQTSLSLLSGAAVNPIPPAQDQFGREPFQHPRLQGLNGLTEQIKHDAIEKRKLARLADRYGLEHVVRWKPKRVGNLEGSGLPAIMAQALYAIVGAISLQRGGIVANDVVKDRILNPLGLR